MRYLKPFFESIKNPDYSEIDKIIEEIKTLSHILNDEGYDVNVEQKNFKLNQHHLPSKFELYDIAIVIDITSKYNHNVMAIKNGEFYEEWVERLYDICKEYKMFNPVIYPTNNRLKMVISTKRRIKLESPKVNETLKFVIDLYKEVKEIGYIMEDEGFQLEYDYNDEEYSRAPLYLEITMRSKKNLDKKSDYFLEYMDRLKEIIDSEIPTFDYHRISNNFKYDWGNKSGIYTRRIMIPLE